VAAPALMRSAWIAGAVAAAGLLVAVAFHGERPGAGLDRYVPAGVMVALDPVRVTAVEVARGERRWKFLRARGGWETPTHAAADGPDIELGLRFLHGSAQQRTIEADEQTEHLLSEIGLEPPLLVVTVIGASDPPFVVELGTANPQGLARYARVAGRREVVLLNRYVAEAWEKAIAR
jgi:hypothetical protein